MINKQNETEQKTLLNKVGMKVEVNDTSRMGKYKPNVRSRNIQSTCENKQSKVLKQETYPRSTK